MSSNSDITGSLPDPSRPSEVRAYLRATGFRPSAAMGQNFLIDRNVLDRMIEAAAVTVDDHVLEIGPGLGVLTAPLLARARRVTAVEKDTRLYEGLITRFGQPSNGRFVLGDYLVLAAADHSLLEADLMVSNLPYSVAARILVMLALAASPPDRMVVTVQKEVADRLVAVPGSSAYGLLSVLMSDEYRMIRLREISPSCFLPVPAVWSAVVGFRRRILDEADRPQRPVGWLPLVRHAFSRRRKQMAGILCDGPWANSPRREQAADWLETAGIDPVARPETIDAEGWRRLAQIGQSRGFTV